MKLTGHGGQSLGFALAKGVYLEVEGDSNDFVGKVMKPIGFYGHPKLLVLHLFKRDYRAARLQCTLTGMCWLEGFKLRTMSSLVTYVFMGPPLAKLSSAAKPEKGSHIPQQTS